MLLYFYTFLSPSCSLFQRFVSKLIRLSLSNNTSLASPNLSDCEWHAHSPTKCVCVCAYVVLRGYLVFTVDKVSTCGSLAECDTSLIYTFVGNTFRYVRKGGNNSNNNNNNNYRNSRGHIVTLVARIIQHANNKLLTRNGNN